MAEKSAAKKRAPRQQMLDALAEAEPRVAERREAAARPDEKTEARAVAAAVAIAEEISTRGVVESIGELKATVSKTLATMSDRLEEQVARYMQFQRAIAAKEQELKEIYDIQRAATTLTALFEAHENKKTALEAELTAERENLEQEIEQTRSLWEQERKQREAEIKERDAAETKRREREKTEYLYAFTREQQQARDAFADQTAKQEKELAEKKAALEKDFAQREQALASREQELAALRAKAEAFPKDLDAAVARAVKDTTARLTQESTSREELLKRDHAGEKNVLTTRIASLEQIVHDQAQRLNSLLAQTEKAYAQVQEIAVRAVEGSAAAKQLAGLQQLLAEQPRKASAER
ncbi:MAG TPA: hypothetical protein VH253_14795 [Phycisphaerae bacterium]|nr:hypothetical protein [Phycisphaerae bacterium]